MQPPGFWFRPPEAPGLATRALWPLSRLWQWQTARRIARGPGAGVGVPVVCVGNLMLGGSGKTPTVSALLQRLAGRGVAAHALSRGYGGSLPGPLRVDPERHDAGEVGDEPLLLAAFGPAWVSRDRLAGAKAAAAAGARMILLDDGFQNPALAKALSVVVVDAETGFGNGRVVPAGPLREPVTTGLGRADFALLIGARAARERCRARWPELASLPCLEGALEPLPTGMDWAGLRCLAFAGIGRPGKFFRTLQGLGADIRITRAFPDHARYSRALAQRLIAEAARANCQLVTTEKDAVRFPADLRPQLISLPVRLELEDWGPLDAALERLL